MGEYKVPQDVEAEDKIIGFLTLKQFIYAVIGVAWGIVSWQLFKAVPVVFLIVGVPPTLVFLLLGLYQRQGQPFETYFVALVSFYFKPRHRLWHKDPILEVFKLEAPKITADISQRDPEQVRSQLEHLAQVVDTRGWTEKQPEIQEPKKADFDPNDRLATIAAPAPAIATDDVGLSDDILDFQNNPSAQNLSVLIEDSVKNIRQEAIDKMKTSTPAPTQSTSKMTAPADPGILKLATEGGDLTVKQVAAQAQKQVSMAEGQTVSVRPDQAPQQGAV